MNKILRICLLSETILMFTSVLHMAFLNFLKRYAIMHYIWLPLHKCFHVNIQTTQTELLPCLLYHVKPENIYTHQALSTNCNCYRNLRNFRNCYRNLRVVVINSICTSLYMCGYIHIWTLWCYEAWFQCKRF